MYVFMCFYHFFPIKDCEQRSLPQIFLAKIRFGFVKQCSTYFKLVVQKNMVSFESTTSTDCPVENGERSCMASIPIISFFTRSLQKYEKFQTFRALQSSTFARKIEEKFLRFFLHSESSKLVSKVHQFTVPRSLLLTND